MTTAVMICETGQMPAAPEPSPEYVTVARAYARLDEEREEKRKELLPLLLDEVRRGVIISRLSKESGYAQSYISRLARNAGIPARVDREAPRHKPKAAESTADTADADTEA